MKWVMAAVKRILIIEDEPKLAEVVQSYLLRDGYEADVAADGSTGLRLHEERPYDLVLLDLMLPGGLAGEQVCKRLRQTSRVAVIMLTAKSAEEDKIAGLHLGADDYVTKPFSPKELVARVAAVLRRTSQEDLLADEFWLTETLVLDDRAKEIRRQGEKLSVTPTEFKLLHTFAQHPRRSFTRGELIEKAFGFDFEGEERVIDTHIKNLRRKIEDDPKDPRIIVSVYGVGYRLGDL